LNLVLVTNDHTEKTQRKLKSGQSTSAKSKKSTKVCPYPGFVTELANMTVLIKIDRDTIRIPEARKQVGEATQSLVTGSNDINRIRYWSFSSRNASGFLHTGAAPTRQKARAHLALMTLTRFFLLLAVIHANNYGVPE